MVDERRYYARHSAVTDPGPLSPLLDALPENIADLATTIHALVGHRDTLPFLYGIKLPLERVHEADMRYVERILERLVALDARPLNQSRPPERRFAGSCRDFAVVLCAAFRQKQVPARVRCGFADYWRPGDFEDHWVCEYWNNKLGRWVLVDAEIGEPERRRFAIEFDHLDVPRDRFIAAGAAWNLCRRGDRDPLRFGVHSIGVKGLWFVRSNLLRDLASLNNVELLPWDYTDFFDRQFASIISLPPVEIALLDRIAEVTSGDWIDFDAVTWLYKSHPELQVGDTVISYTLDGRKIVPLILRPTA